MGTAAEWFRVLALGAFWGSGMFVWEAIAGRKSFASVLNLASLALASLLFGMFMVFEWRVVHDGVVVIFVMAILGLLIVGLLERRARIRAEKRPPEPPHKQG